MVWSIVWLEANRRVSQILYILKDSLYGISGHIHTFKNHSSSCKIQRMSALLTRNHVCSTKLLQLAIACFSFLQRLMKLRAFVLVEKLNLYNCLFASCPWLLHNSVMEWSWHISTGPTFFTEKNVDDFSSLFNCYPMTHFKNNLGSRVFFKCPKQSQMQRNAPQSLQFDGSYTGLPS